MCLGCNPGTSHVRASDARTDATSAAHHGAAGAEHQEGLQAAGKLCPVLAVDLGGKRGECGWVGAELAAGTASRHCRQGSTLLVWAGRRRCGSLTILCSLSISC